MRYPTGYFCFVCVWVLIGGHCYLSSCSLIGWICYFILGLFFFKLSKVRVASWPFLSCFILSLFVLYRLILSCLSIPQKGCFLRGQLQFQKLFHTQKNNVGGLCYLTLKSGETIPLYLHIFSKNEAIDAETAYVFSGYVKPLRNPFKSSQNFSFYLWSRHIRYHVTSAHLQPLRNTSLSFLQKVRKKLSKALVLTKEDYSRVFRAILLGKKEDVSKEQLQHFLYTGTMHLFAVSGLHVGVVSAFVFFLCRLFCFPIWLRWIITSSGVVSYALIVGLSPSTLRAAWMALFLLTAQLLNRPMDVRIAFFNTISLSLCLNPFELWDVGFQLSYGVVASILFIGIPFSQWYAKKMFYVSSWRLTCIISFWASLMSCVFSIYYWNLLSPWAFFSNLFLIPFASLIVVLGVVTWCIYCVCPLFMPCIQWISETIVTLLLKSVALLEKIPGTALTCYITSCTFYFLMFCFMLWLAISTRSVHYEEH